MELDRSILSEKNDNSIETERRNDYTINQLRSFAFCKAETVANKRLYRLDELKAVIDQIASEDGIKNYINLREEIIGSYAIELDEDLAKEISKEDKIEHNKKAGQGLVNLLG